MAIGKGQSYIESGLEIRLKPCGESLQHGGFIQIKWQQQVSHSFLSGICETWIVQPPFAGSGS
jgi:hypothetical protein